MTDLPPESKSVAAPLFAEERAFLAGLSEEERRRIEGISFAELLEATEREVRLFTAACYDRLLAERH